MTDRPRVLRQPGIMSGDWTVEGTRVRAVDVLIQLLDGGMGVDEIREMFPTLPPSAVETIVDWAIVALRERVPESTYGPEALEVLAGLSPLRKRPDGAMLLEVVDLDRDPGETDEDYERRRALFEDTPAPDSDRFREWTLRGEIGDLLDSTEKMDLSTLERLVVELRNVFENAKD